MMGRQRGPIAERPRHPAGDPPARSQNAARLRHDAGWLGHVRHAEADGHRVEAGIRKRKLHRVAIDETRPRHRCTGKLEHGSGEIEAGHPRSGRDKARIDVAVPATEVERIRVRPRIHGGDKVRHDHIRGFCEPARIGTGDARFRPFPLFQLCKGSRISHDPSSRSGTRVRPIHYCAAPPRS